MLSAWEAEHEAAKDLNLRAVNDQRLDSSIERNQGPGMEILKQKRDYLSDQRAVERGVRDATVGSQTPATHLTVALE